LQHIVDDLADLAQRMPCRHTLFKIDVRKKLSRPQIRTPHPNLPAIVGRTESYSPRLVSNGDFSSLLESFRLKSNREGFPNQSCCDSSFVLEVEASTDGATLFSGFA
jgi:hypothetical protein